MIKKKKVMYHLVSPGKNGLPGQQILKTTTGFRMRNVKKNLVGGLLEIYYGWKSTQIVKASLDCVGSDVNIITSAPK